MRGMWLIATGWQTEPSLITCIIHWSSPSRMRFIGDHSTLSLSCSRTQDLQRIYTAGWPQLIVAVECLVNLTTSHDLLASILLLISRCCSLSVVFCCKVNSVIFYNQFIMTHVSNIQCTFRTWVSLHGAINTGIWWGLNPV